MDILNGINLKAIAQDQLGAEGKLKMLVVPLLSAADIFNIQDNVQDVVIAVNRVGVEHTSNNKERNKDRSITPGFARAVQSRDFDLNHLVLKNGTGVHVEQVVHLKFITEFVDNVLYYVPANTKFFTDSLQGYAGDVVSGSVIKDIVNDGAYVLPVAEYKQEFSLDYYTKKHKKIVDTLQAGGYVVEELIEAQTANRALVKCRDLCGGEHQITLGK